MIETLVPATIIKFDINFLAIFQNTFFLHDFLTITIWHLTLLYWLHTVRHRLNANNQERKREDFDRNHWILFSSKCVSVAVCVGPTCCVSGEAGLVTERSAQSSQSSPHLPSHKHQPANLSKSFFKGRLKTNFLSIFFSR